MAEFCSTAVPLFGAFIAAFLVLRFGWLGFVAGFLAFWGFSYLRLELLYYFDPQRDAGVFDAVVVGVISPMLGFVWCSSFLLVRFFYRWQRARRVRHAEPPLID